jgi:hypothetical protein
VLQPVPKPEPVHHTRSHRSAFRTHPAPNRGSDRSQPPPATDAGASR